MERSSRTDILNTLHQHYPEYAIEAAGLGLLIMSAVANTLLWKHPDSPLSAAIADPMMQRLGISVGMCLTIVTLVYSQWGMRSGAHFNPVVTLTFFRLGKVKRWDAFFYILFQFLGGSIGLFLAAKIFGSALSHPAINYIVTKPGSLGVGVAFCAELGISFGMMLMVLIVSNSPSGRYTGLFAALLVATYITFEAPLSGSSMNPARSLASAISAEQWQDLWIYFIAPPSGMFLAAEVYLRHNGKRSVHCAKLNHPIGGTCIFRCNYTMNLTNGLSDSFDRIGKQH